MWVLAVFALAVGLSLAAHLNDGYAILVFPPYRAELSLNLAILLWIAGFVLGYMLLRMVAHTLRLPLYVRDFRARSVELAVPGVERHRLVFESRPKPYSRRRVAAFKVYERVPANSPLKRNAEIQLAVDLVLAAAVPEARPA